MKTTYSPDGHRQDPPIWYVDPAEQIYSMTRFLKCNGRGSKGFSPKYIPAIPEDFKPNTPTEVLMLMAYLPDKDGISSLERTFEAWWNFIAPPINMPLMRWDALKSDSGSMRLIPECKYSNRPGIRWIAFDPCANKGRSVKSCRQDPAIASHLAGVEVLAAMAIFPEWLPLLCQAERDHPHLGACVCITPRSEQNPGGNMLVPHIVLWSSLANEAGLITSWADITSRINTTPTIREC